MSGVACARCSRPLRPDWLRHPDPPPPPGTFYPLAWARRWPEGPICTGCFMAACETYGRCPGCGVDRMLPGRDSTGQAVCTDCGGGLGDFTCARCGQEAHRYRAGSCARCVLRDQLAAALDRGDGTMPATLIPFYDKVTAMARPRSGLLWLSRAHVPVILQTLARGQVPLTHAGLSTLTPARSVSYIRDLLISSGVLPPADRFLLLFEQWLPGWLADIPDPDHAKILHRFATWDQLRKLRRHAATTGPIGPYRNQNARHTLRQAAAFLTDLHHAGTTLADATQTDLDAWQARATRQQHNHLRTFWRWAVTTRHAPRLHLRPDTPTTSAVPDGLAQLRTLRRILTDATIPAADRVIAMLVALYAQPLSRIVWLTTADIIQTPITDHADGLRGATAVTIRLGDPPAPIPPPLDSLLLQHLATRANQTTATNPDSPLLFPGRRAGQPIHPTTARLRLHALNIPNLANRRSGLHQLLQHTPAPVVAEMLGYSHPHTEHLATNSGITWARYINTRTPRPTQKTPPKHPPDQQPATPTP